MKKKILTVILAASMALALCACGFGKSDDTEINTEKTSENSTEESTESLFETVDGTETTEATELEEATETTETTEATEATEETEEEETSVSNPGEVIAAGSDTPVAADQAVAATPGATDIPDTSTEGTAESPYLVTPDANMSVTTVTIGAGQNVYYSIYRIGNMWCTIENPNAYVIMDGVTYTGGFMIKDALASDAVTIQIGNAGSEPASFTLRFSNPTGSFNNPTIVTTAELAAGVGTHIYAGDHDGHCYQYVAEATGTMIFRLATSTPGVTPALNVTNASTMANRSFEADVLYDEAGAAYIAIDVTAGDILQINVGVCPDAMWNYPEADIVWAATF